MSCSVCLGYDDYRCPCCSEPVRKVTCPDCEGSGYTPYMAYDIKARREIPVTRLAYEMLPIDEDTADSLRMRCCKVEIDICPTCMGEGKIPKEF